MLQQDELCYEKYKYNNIILGKYTCIVTLFGSYELGIYFFGNKLLKWNDFTAHYCP